MKKTILILVLFWLLIPDIRAQQFSRAEVTSIDSSNNSYTADYTVKISFKLDEQAKTLLIEEDGEIPVLIRFDEVWYRKNGSHLITSGKPDYFIINDNWVLHHREYKTEHGVIIIRNKYFNESKLIRI